MKKELTVLGIESSCDETAAAVVRGGKKILSNVIYSQIETHREFGGVFPELACRKHLDLLLPTVERALKEAEMTPSDLDLIAVAHTPGLIGALLMGVSAAKALAYGWNLPFIGVNHIEAHLYASFMSAEEEVTLPAIGLVISGGHTALLKIDAIGKYTKIGSTVDDAVGEAFDKVAKMLCLPYPGGPEIEKLAKQGNPQKYPFTIGQVKKAPFNFSFSGLKTQVLYALKGQNGLVNQKTVLSEESYPDIAASFQEIACQSLVLKTLAAAKEFECRSIVIGGGVANNNYLRDMFAKNLPENLSVYWPKGSLSIDNAAMIAGLGGVRYLENPTPAPLTLTPTPTSKELFLHL